MGENVKNAEKRMFSVKNKNCNINSLKIWFAYELLLGCRNVQYSKL